jgi:DDE family transposase
LAEAGGIETPRGEQLAKKRKNKASNDDWRNPHDPDAKITKMKDGRMHLAHKGEHAVDLETGAIVGVTVQPADRGDTTSLNETVDEMFEAMLDARRHGAEVELPREVVGDKGYQSNDTCRDLSAVGLRSYLWEPDRGKRNWKGEPAEREAVYGNRRWIRGRHGKALLRKRGERVERSFAHCYETGGIRRTHLRGHPKILKRLLIHTAGFNLGLLMRKVFGVGTPRSVQDRLAALWGDILRLIRALSRTFGVPRRPEAAFRARCLRLASIAAVSSAA